MTYKLPACFAMTARFRASIGFALMVVSAMALGGCVSGANVTSEIKVPKPLVESVPISVGLHISKALSEAFHEEKIVQQGKFTIELGESQQHLFKQVFGALFSEVVPVQSLTEPPSGVAAVIVPRIIDADISIPQQTPGDFYEVWIQYSIRIVNSDGDEIMDWVVPAYGRANRHNFSNPLDRPTQALEKARNNAIRDAATQITFEFIQQPAVRDWLSEIEET